VRVCFSTQDGFSGAQGAGEAPPATTVVDFDEMKSLISPRLRYCQVAGSASFSNRKAESRFPPKWCRNAFAQYDFERGTLEDDRVPRVTDEKEPEVPLRRCLAAGIQQRGSGGVTF